METYENRFIETATVRHYSEGGITLTSGWGWGLTFNKEWAKRIVPGATIEVEQCGSTITGIRLPGEEWLYRWSDQELEEQRQRFAEAFEQENRERLEKNREDWARREAALPEDLRARLQHFRERGGERFEIDGWGYELIVAELAVLYREAGYDEEGRLIESEAIEEYARQHGTSGNQHGVAKLLVLAGDAEDGMPPKDVPGALTPLGVSPDYGARP